MSEILTAQSTGVSRSEILLNRLLWAVIGILCLFIAAELIFHFVLAPRLLIRNVVVRSDLPLSRDEVLSIAGIREKEYYFSLKLEEVRDRLEAFPLIREAVVEKIFPDTLKFTLYGREPLVIALVDAADRSVPVAIDREGVLFQIGTALTDWDLPVISGLKFQDLRAGMELPDRLETLLGELHGIRQSSPGLFRLISEIRVVPKSGRDYEILVWSVLHPVSLRFGRSISSGILKNAVLILDLLAKQDLAGKVTELDLRTGEVVYRIRED